MTDLLDQAVKIVRDLPADVQDDIARIVFELAGHPSDIVALTPDEKDAIALSKAAAARGDFASDEEVSAVWAKYEL